MPAHLPNGRRWGVMMPSSGRTIGTGRTDPYRGLSRADGRTTGTNWLCRWSVPFVPIVYTWLLHPPDAHYGTAGIAAQSDPGLARFDQALVAEPDDHLAGLLVVPAECQTQRPDAVPLGLGVLPVEFPQEGEFLLGLLLRGSLLPGALLARSPV